MNSSNKNAKKIIIPMSLYYFIVMGLMLLALLGLLIAVIVNLILKNAEAAIVLAIFCSVPLIFLIPGSFILLQWIVLCEDGIIAKNLFGTIKEVKWSAINNITQKQFSLGVSNVKSFFIIDDGSESAEYKKRAHNKFNGLIAIKVTSKSDSFIKKYFPIK